MNERSLTILEVKWPGIFETLFFERIRTAAQRRKKGAFVEFIQLRLSSNLPNVAKRADPVGSSVFISEKRLPVGGSRNALLFSEVFSPI